MKQKIVEIEILRGFAALAVVLIHVSATYLQPKGDDRVFLLLSAFNTFPKFAVQMFIFISGMVLFYSYSDRECKAGSFYIKRFKYLLLPYAFWTAVYLCNRAGFLSKPFLEQGLLFLQNFINGKGSYHLYFILLILQFYLLFPLLHKYIQRFGLGKRLLFWSAIGYLLLVYLDYYTGSIEKYLPNYLVLIRSHLFVYWYIYFLLGAYAGINFKKWQTKIKRFVLPSGILMLITWGIITFEYYFSVRHSNIDYGLAATPLKPSIYVYTMVSIIVLYALAQHLAKKDSILKKIFTSAGKYSLGIYFAHPLILKFVAGWQLSSLIIVNFVLTYILTVAITWGFAMVFSKNKKAALMMGTA